MTIRTEGRGMRELRQIPALRAALEDARDYTLQLYAHLTPEQRDFPCLRTVNPPAWEIAHVGWFQEFWCLRFREDAGPLPARLENADPLLNSAIIPHQERWKHPELTWDSVHDYLARELEGTLAALERSTPGQRYFFQLALLHEDMHGEALLMSLQTLGLPQPRWKPPAPQPPEGLVALDVEFTGGELEMGSAPGPDFAFDNEKPACRVELAPFALATAQVTNGEYLEFVNAGGYTRQDYWTAPGWQWRSENNVMAPRYWRNEGSQWLARRFDRWEALAPEEPVVHVNAFEAEAYCRFAGRRLPTEAEWEFAARHGLAAGEDRYPWGLAAPAWGTVNLNGAYGRPVHAGALADGDTHEGIRQMIGNVWEWTATDFNGYPGFR
ncbi:MAG: SUMF1/EgtB/PvdO family nonheme iron enzyme, partial [Burkholderiales bacterium]